MCTLAEEEAEAHAPRLHLHHVDHFFVLPFSCMVWFVVMVGQVVPVERDCHSVVPPVPVLKYSGCHTVCSDLCLLGTAVARHIAVRLSLSISLI